MKLYRITLFFIVTSWGFVNAQNKQLMYDFREVPQALITNPGMEVNYDWYAGVPILSGVSFQAASSGVSVNDIFANDGLDVNDKVRDRVLSALTPRDELSGAYQIELINIGFRGKKNPQNFYSLGIFNEGDAIGYWFKDLALLAFDGNANQLGRRFDLSHVNTKGEVLNVFHFGVNKQVNQNLTVGVRAKVYSSIAHFQSTQNEGFFVTTEGQNNILANTLVSDVEIKTAGLNDIENSRDSGEVSSIITKRGFFGGDLGLGADFGFTYNLNPQTQITASILDLGFVYHTDDVRNFNVKGNVTVEGVEVFLPEDLANTNNDFWQNLVDNIEELIPFEEDNESYISFRPTKLNASIRYNFGESYKINNRRGNCDCNYRTSNRISKITYSNAIGAQLYAINRPRGPQAALTAFYQQNFGNTLALKTTYTIDKFSFSNVGLGINLQAGPVNIYAMADNLLAYENIADSRYVSFQLGLNIISWGKN